jgi:hypothetical protein
MNLLAATYYSDKINGVLITTEIKPDSPLSEEVVNIVFHFQNASSFEAIDVNNLTLVISRDSSYATFLLQKNPHKGHYELNYTFDKEGRYFILYTFQYEGKQYGDRFYIDVKPNFFPSNKTKSDYGLIALALMLAAIFFIMYTFYRKR